MENWQLTLVILTSVLVGALIPLLVILAAAVHRAGREIGAIGAQLRRTLTQVETISDRVEALSRGLVGGETNIADLLASVGTLSRSLDRNMKIVNVLSSIMASAGSAAAAYMQTRLEGPEDGPRPAPPAVSPEATVEAQQ